MLRSCGASVPSVVPIRAPTETAIGRTPRRGRTCGDRPPLTATRRLPLRAAWLAPARALLWVPRAGAWRASARAWLARADVWRALSAAVRRAAVAAACLAIWRARWALFALWAFRAARRLAMIRALRFSRAAAFRYLAHWPRSLEEKIAPRLFCPSARMLAVGGASQMFWELTSRPRLPPESTMSKRVRAASGSSLKETRMPP